MGVTFNVCIFLFDRDENAFYCSYNSQEKKKFQQFFSGNRKRSAYCGEKTNF